MLEQPEVLVRNARLAWTDELRGAPTLANGSVYVLSQDNQIFAIDQNDGKVQWAQSGTLETQGVFGVAAPAASQGTIVAGFSSGELNAYRYENGRTLWQDALSRTSITTASLRLISVTASIGPTSAPGRMPRENSGNSSMPPEVIASPNNTMLSGLF